MKRLFHLMILAAMALGLTGPVRAQFVEQGLGGGIGFGGTFGQTELRDRETKFLARGFLRYGLAPHIQGELSAGLGTVAGSEYRTQIVPIDYRFLFSPFSEELWNAYVYAGAGLLHRNIETMPPHPTAGIDIKGSKITRIHPD